eukprot:3403485-Amphidinium_carterae.1
MGLPAWGNGLEDCLCRPRRIDDIHLETAFEEVWVTAELEKVTRPAGFCSHICCNGMLLAHMSE